MAIAASMIPEFKLEMANTRRLLERLPEGKDDWRPHAKSYTLGQLSRHIVDTVGWFTYTMQSEGIDFAQPMPRQELSGRDALLALFDRLVPEAEGAIAGASDDAMMQQWTARAGEHVVFTVPRAGVLRSMCMNHLIHHRGQLTVYLRELDVPLPGLYGPSADEA